MTCPICDKDEWKKLPGAHSQSLLQVCKGCGYLCHEVDPAKEAEVREYYRKKYKPVLNIAAIVTASNKLQYITRFLDGWLRDKKGLLCADIGAATGYVLNYLRRRGHRVSGSEWVVANRRFSEQFYGIPLCEDLPERKDYDLLCMYHVLEHLVEPGAKLVKYAGMLGPEGRFLIATPKWLGLLQEESGNPIVSKDKDTAQKAFDTLFHKDHINLFTPRSLRNLFNRSGLSVVEEDYECYGQTYLLRKGDTKPIEPEDWQQVMERISSQRKALDCFFAQEYKDATKAWPPFPEAWVALIFGVYGKDPERQSDMMGEMDKSARQSWRFMMAEAQWLARMERLEEALALSDRILKKRFMADIIFFMGEVLTRLGRYRDANEAFAQVAAQHPQRWAECYGWIVANATKMPAWDERADAKIVETLFQQAKAQDPLPAPGPVG